ncbi:heavy metal-associated isoprenylated plant protein 4 [Alnus glutinosa]|uniref:heavy metal-associated isoprenylated plant protein 4 n=1 Tax=Alnus glutinosa TaxID=3517 RepID=UPI002D77DFA6|nr:heavy metal-associated isoprenylated plant protein 4 [Alnus glutinosa]
MAGEDGKKEKEKDEKDGKKEKEKVEEVITAVYKVNIHCQQCARDIKNPLTRTQGVHAVDIDDVKGELKVRGVIDPSKIHKQIEKLSKKKVELVSPKPKIKELVEIKKVVEEIKQPIVRTTSVKVNMHCDKCEQDLRKRLLKHKGIYSVKTDKKAETLTVEGTIEPDKLLSYLKKKVHKHAEIITTKPEKKEKEKGDQGNKSTDQKPSDKSEGKSTEKPSDKGEGKSTEKTSEKSEGKSTEKTSDKGEGKSTEKPSDKGEGKSGGGKTTEKPSNKGEDKSGGEKTTEKPTESTKIIEVMEEIKIVEVKTKEGKDPYFIHYVYAPQMFSDENPNACSVM